MARITGSHDAGQIRDFLIFKNVNPVMAAAAAQQVANGFVDPKTIRQLKRRGVTGGYRSQRPARPVSRKPKRVLPDLIGNLGRPVGK